MTTTASDQAVAVQDSGYLSYRTLIWRRFRKNRMGIAAAAVLAMFYFAALFAGHFSPYDHNEIRIQVRYLPPQDLHFDWSGGFYVNGLTSTQNPVTLELEYETDPSRRYPVRFLSRDGGGDIRLIHQLPARHHPGRALRLFRRLDRPRPAARRRDPGLLSAHPPLDGPGRGTAGRMDEHRDLPGHHDHPVHHQLGRPGPRSPGQGPRVPYIISRHLLPGCYSHIIVVATLAIPGMILGETALSFLGLGIRPPMTSWGVLLEEAQRVTVLLNHPWLLFPAAPVLVVVIAFNFLGDALRDAADPYS